MSRGQGLSRPWDEAKGHPSAELGQPVKAVDPLATRLGRERADRSILVVDLRSTAGGVAGSAPTFAGLPSGSALVPAGLRATDLVLAEADHELDLLTNGGPGRVVTTEPVPGSSVATVVGSLLASRVPDWLPLPSAAEVLSAVSTMLLGYLGLRGRSEEAASADVVPTHRPLPDGTLVWSGWGGPSVSLVSDCSRSWTRSSPGFAVGPVKGNPQSRPTSDAEPVEDAGSMVIEAPIWGFDPADGLGPHESGPDLVAGRHVMVDRLPPRRSDRLELLTELWAPVTTDGFLALTYAVDDGARRSRSTVGAQPDNTTIDDNTAVDHQRLVEDLLEATSGRILTDDVAVHASSAVGITWATLVLRRLGAGAASQT